MKAAAKCKLAIDAAMAIAMLLLMAYGLIGEKSHEWIGVGMLILLSHTTLQTVNGMERLEKEDIRVSALCKRCL